MGNSPTGISKFNIKTKRKSWTHQSQTLPLAATADMAAGMETGADTPVGDEEEAVEAEVAVVDAATLTGVGSKASAIRSPTTFMI